MKILNTSMPFHPFHVAEPDLDFDPDLVPCVPCTMFAVTSLRRLKPVPTGRH